VAYVLAYDVPSVPSFQTVSRKKLQCRETVAGRYGRERVVPVYHQQVSCSSAERAVDPSLATVIGNLGN